MANKIQWWIVYLCSLPLLYVCIDHRHWFHWTAVWLQLHVSLVHISACSFAVSQASDLALLVGYVGKIVWPKRTLTLHRMDVVECKFQFVMMNPHAIEQICLIWRENIFCLATQIYHASPSSRLPNESFEAKSPCHKFLIRHLLRISKIWVVSGVVIGAEFSPVTD